MSPTKQLLPVSLLLLVSFCLPARSNAQLWISFSGAQDKTNTCYADLNWSVADIGLSQTFLIVQRSNDGGTTFNAIGYVTVPQGDLGNGNTWNGTYQDQDPYTPSGNLYTNGANALEYRLYFPSGNSYSTVFALSGLPTTSGSCSGLVNNCSNGSSISGPSSTTVNTPTNYSLTSGTQVNFSILYSNPANIATVSSGPDPNHPGNWLATVTFSASGIIDLQASFPVCGNSPLTLPICTGAPLASSLSIVSQGPDVCPDVPVSFGARYGGSCTNYLDAGITNVNWMVSPAAKQIVSNAGTAGCGHGTNSGVTITFNPTPTMYNVTITASNVCGTSGTSSPYVVTILPPGSCGGLSPLAASALAGSPRSVNGEQMVSHATAAGFAISPNPSSGQVLVTLPRSGAATGSSLFKDPDAGQPAGVHPSVIRKIDVYSLVGRPLRSLQYGDGIGGSLTVDLGDFANGLYIMVITTDVGKFNEKVMIAK